MSVSSSLTDRTIDMKGKNVDYVALMRGEAILEPTLALERAETALARLRNMSNRRLKKNPDLFFLRLALQASATYWRRELNQVLANPEGRAQDDRYFKKDPGLFLFDGIVGDDAVKALALESFKEIMDPGPSDPLAWPSSQS